MNEIYPSNVHVTISSDTLFHFTCNIDHVRGILEDEFRPHLSLEDLPWVERTGIKLAIPMVSFCDIPLSQTLGHMQYYGSYGIGLSKSWGQRNGVTPVLYTYKDSPLTASFNHCYAWAIKKLSNVQGPYLTMQEIDLSKELAEHHQSLLRILCFLKLYEGPLRRGDQTFPNVRFYDEREWRFVPQLREPLSRYLLTEKGYNNTTTLADATSEIQTQSRISFEPPDIKYIIISKNEEILPMIKMIEEIKGDRYSEDEIKVLSSRIIPAEQIASDF